MKKIVVLLVLCVLSVNVSAQGGIGKFLGGLKQLVGPKPTGRAYALQLERRVSEAIVRQTIGVQTYAQALQHTHQGVFAQRDGLLKELGSYAAVEKMAEVDYVNKQVSLHILTHRITRKFVEAQEDLVKIGGWAYKGDFQQNYQMDNAGLNKIKKELEKARFMKLLEHGEMLAERYAVLSPLLDRAALLKMETISLEQMAVYSYLNSIAKQSYQHVQELKEQLPADFAHKTEWELSSHISFHRIREASLQLNKNLLDLLVFIKEENIMDLEKIRQGHGDLPANLLPAWKNFLEVYGYIE